MLGVDPMAGGVPPFVLPLEDTTSQLFQDAAVTLTESNTFFDV